MRPACVWSGIFSLKRTTDGPRLAQISLDHELILFSCALSKRLQTSSWLACAYNSKSMAFSKKLCPDHELILFSCALSKRLQTSSWLACAYNSKSMAFSKKHCPDFNLLFSFRKDEESHVAMLVARSPRWRECCQTQSSRAADVWSRSGLFRHHQRTLNLKNKPVAAKEL